MKHLVLAVLLTTGSVLPAMAQPQWRFHLAFEDGAGARDTIWIIYDVNATVGWGPGEVDHGLGEGGVAMDPNTFNVWMLNWDFDSTKTKAFPYTQYPNFDGITIDAFNWEPPVTLRWDTSLFHAPYLPYVQGSFGIATMGGDHFFFFNNHPELQAFDMLIDDSVFVPQDGGFLFPFGVYFGASDGVSVSERSVDHMRITPNPARDRTSIKGEPTVRYDLHLIDINGSVVLRSVFTGSTELELGALSAGIYLCRIAGSDGSMTLERVVIGR